MKTNPRSGFYKSMHDTNFTAIVIKISVSMVWDFKQICVGSGCYSMIFERKETIVKISISKVYKINLY